jgi:Tfp pilus assembly PilM family ATPase
VSDSLAIEWGDEQLVLLQGKASGKHISAKRAAVLNWPDGIDPIKDSERAAEWLKGELTTRGFSGKAIVSLPREGVVVRHLELPNIPDDELPGMVKLQAATKVTQAADKYLLDYVPLPPRGSDTRDVLMTTVPTEVTGTIKKILSAAGVELGAVGVSSFHSAELVLHQQDNKSRWLAVVLNLPRFEVSVHWPHLRLGSTGMEMRCRKL